MDACQSDTTCYAYLETWLVLLGSFLQYNSLNSYYG